MSRTSGRKTLFQKKPLGRRRHLMSSFARSETANLVSATSGTERERGFVGIEDFLCEPPVNTCKKHTANICDMPFVIPHLFPASTNTFLENTMIYLFILLLIPLSLLYLISRFHLHILESFCQMKIFHILQYSALPF